MSISLAGQPLATPTVVGLATPTVVGVARGWPARLNVHGVYGVSGVPIVCGVFGVPSVTGVASVRCVSGIHDVPTWTPEAPQTL